MRIEPEAGSIEVGHICLAPALQRTRAASEAIYLFADWVFREGYRRFEWKCDVLNRRSRRAAQRFGFSFEGVFRNHMIVKGRNRDTAWFAITDGDWACLKPAWETWLEPGNFVRRAAAGGARGAHGAVPGGVGPRGVSRKGAVRRWQRRWKDGWVGDLDAPGARQAATIDMLIFDHGLVRRRGATCTRWTGRLALEPAGPGDDPAAGGARVQGDPEPARARPNTGPTCWSARPAGRLASSSSTSS